MDTQERETRRLLRKHATLVRTAGGHEIYKTGDGGMLVVACRGRKTKGPSGFWKQALAQTRRAVDRAKGMKPPVKGLVEKMRQDPRYERAGKIEDLMQAETREPANFCSRCSERVLFKVFKERKPGQVGIRKFKFCRCGHEEEI